MVSIRLIQRVQKQNRRNASYQAMADLRDAAAEVLVDDYTRYRRSFKLGTVMWGDGNSAAVSANLDTGETRVTVFVGDEVRGPGDQWIGDPEAVPESFPSLEAAYDWIQESIMAANNTIPARPR